MSSTGDGPPVALTFAVARTKFAEEVDRDSAAIKDWLHGGPKPDFLEIGRRLLPVYDQLVQRRWYEPDDFVAEWVEEMRDATRDADEATLHADVAWLVEILRNALRGSPPPRPPRPGPRAGQMALRKKDR